ncbi:sugar ABC transporter ATP-binding protein [Cryobacterium arcticum]|uniref:Ribose import ATP-binding protein RbsA n=1 Tax=Cryobacterium arcticum TaxID=670052 RepID=A0A1B1BQN6_9MICO|nr:sugar ABC transporter ATP-binding protein [Cryobacterium arcticum]ANP74886.1 Ribose import ATP-binding protein RbsA [Cryobacterium arcticum]
MTITRTDDAREGEEAVRPLLSLRGISKKYPGVQALSDVSLELRAGQGHALVGENGAGKSTLIKVIAGLVAPDEGEILVNGAVTVIRTPAGARKLSISLVPQEISLAEDRSVAENIFLGQLPRRAGFVNQKLLLRRASALLTRLGLPNVDPRLELGELSPAVKQMVMIARGIASNGKIFILDEPTATLTGPEIERLFTVIDELKREGAAVLYVSHRLSELERVAEWITVLRDGRVVQRMPMAGTSEDDLVQAMVGRSVERFFDTKTGHETVGDVLLEVSGLGRDGAFSDISFSLRAGEIVGLSGLVGAGRTEVAKAIFGIDKYDRGSVSVAGRSRKIRSPRDAIKAGIALVPEERKAEALVLDFSISNNIVLPHLAELSVLRFFRERRLSKYSSTVAKKAGVKAPSVQTRVGSLSGGNQQKVVLARWFTSHPKVYLLDEPTRGIDVGAKAEIYQAIGGFAQSGATALVISSELPELLGICDRILVMRQGRIVGEMTAAAATEKSLLELAIGTTS